ncbi:hypothetical protein RhiirC2_795949 [Rhizophagus irregularis]|uniref:Uncharacterized protein n=1 Tax=Rhizophagus irregularis TaxID=588596 RepID=A0A2N1MAK3_9GLOM|nr:hypothetical protein RhiirC2_795949 [Rhizophagus irregularis]
MAIIVTFGEVGNVLTFLLPFFVLVLQDSETENVPVLQDFETENFRCSRSVNSLDYTWNKLTLDY